MHMLLIYDLDYYGMNINIYNYALWINFFLLVGNFSHPTYNRNITMSVDIWSMEIDT